MYLSPFKRFTTIVLVALHISAPQVGAQEPSREDQMVTAITRWLNVQANPVYVITTPPQDKYPAVPPNIPVGTFRATIPVPAAEDVITGLPFSMSAPQAVKIGIGLLEDEDFHTALVYFQEAQKLQPSLTDAVVGVARCYYELQRDDDALRIYQSLSEQQSNLWEVQFIRGRIYLERGLFEESVVAFTNAVRLKPDDPDIAKNLGIALTKAGRSSEAISHLSKVTDLQRFEADDFYRLGEAYANLGDWVKAAEAFRQGVEKRAVDPDGYSSWGVMLYNADKLEDALVPFKRAKTIDIQHLESSYYMADIYRRLGNPVEALAHYRLVLKQKPDDLRSLLHAAYLCFKLNLLGEAEQHYIRLKALDPTNAANSNLAALQTSDNEKKKDRNEPTPGVTLREVVAANPNQGDPHINLGAQLITEEVFSEAITVLQKAVTLSPNSAAAHFNLGLAQLKVGDFQNAVVSNEQALKLRPQWSSAYNDLGLSYAGVGKWAEAIQSYVEAIKLTPQYAGAIYNLGRAYVATGKKDQATPLLETLKRFKGFDLQARLANAIGGVESTVPGQNVGGQSVATISVPSPTPTPAPVPDPSPAPTPQVATRVETLPTATDPPPTAAIPESPQPRVTESKEVDKNVSGTNQQPEKITPEIGCRGPIYRPPDVTKLATIITELPAFYTDEALKNNVEGKIVLQAILCSTGRVSEITVEKHLAFGLTERAIELLRLIQFEPATLDGKPVSIMWKQEFNCAQATCKAVP